MSSGQLRVWLTEQLMGSTAANNLCLGLRLSGELNPAALELGLRVVIGRHEALRTTFDLVSGRPVQLVHPASPQVLATQDLSDAPEPEQAAYTAARRAAHTPFDLKRGPLLRAVLLRLGPEQHILLYTLHHIIADGWSLGLFTRELAACYAAFCERRQPALKPLPLQYADCALWEQDWLETEEFRQQLAHYAHRLAGAPPPPSLAGAAVGSAEPAATGASRAIRLPPELVSAMRSTASQMGATVFSLSLAAFQVLLWQLSGREDQVIGVPAARRSRVEFEDIIGLFANIVVVCTALSGNPAFTDLLERTREAMLDALAHEDVPFDRLVQALHPVRSAGGNPVFQILFASVPITAPMEGFGALRMIPYVVEAAAAPFDLSVSLIEEPSGAAWVRAEYRTGIFTSEQISGLLDHYLRLLAEIVARPEMRIAQFGTPPGPWMARQPTGPELPAAVAPQETAGKSASELALQEILTRIWEKVLQYRPPDTQSNFFDLGGHSLQAVAVAHKVSRALGLQIPVSMLFREPTIEGMARRLCAEDRPRSAAVPIFRGGTRPPLFVGGSTPEFRDLSHALEPEQPFFQLDIFALQEQRLIAGEPLLTTIPRIAAEFLRDILAIQPAGPYLLAGQCDGGILALEVALQLQAEGREVALLAQFDTPVDGYYRPVHWARRLGGRFRRGFELTLSGEAPHRVRRLLRGLGSRRPPATPEEQQYLHIWSVIWQAVCNYRQSTLYHGEIQFFRAEERTWFYQDVARGWEGRAERIRVHDVPGNHISFLSGAPGQQRIAEVIGRALGCPASE